MTADSDFIGRGWGFPPAFDKTSAAVETVSGVEDIHQSLEIIFSTALGERIMDPTFGCNLKTMLFEPLNTATEAYIKNLVETAVLYHEPRIDAEAIELQADQAQGSLFIAVNYKVRGTNSRFNYVYPFYINEADR